jgi:hypothetical protein
MGVTQHKCEIAQLELSDFMRVCHTQRKSVLHIISLTDQEPVWL